MRGLPFGLEERRDGVVALTYTLGHLAALYLMCDRHDLGVALGDNSQGEARLERGLMRLGVGPRARAEPPPGEDYEPSVFIYDAYPGGIGLSEPLYRLHDRLLRESRALVAGCPCRDGCPSCVGPVGEVGSRGKEVALRILDAVLG
jgi:DEAD/DEAH box helicase domain-containing protein